MGAKNAVVDKESKRIVAYFVVDASVLYSQQLVEIFRKMIVFMIQLERMLD